MKKQLKLMKLKLLMPTSLPQLMRWPTTPSWLRVPMMLRLPMPTVRTAPTQMKPTAPIVQMQTKLQPLMTSLPLLQIKTMLPMLARQTTHSPS